MNRKSELSGWEHRIQMTSFKDSFMISTPFKVRQYVHESLANACVCTYLLEDLYYKQTGEYVQLSPSFIYAITENPESLLNILSTVKTFGSINILNFPLEGIESNIKQIAASLKDKIWKTGQNFRPSGYVFISTSNEIKSHISNSGPVIAQLNFNSSDYKKLSIWEDEYKTRKTGDTLLPVAVIGYDVDYFYCLCSEGLNFGKDGVIKIDKDLFKSIYVEGWGLKELSKSSINGSSIVYKKFNLKGD